MNKIRTIKIALLFSLLVIITSVVLLVLTVGPPSSSTLNGLKFDGEVLVKQIEEYKRINREYPKTLAQGGISNSESRLRMLDLIFRVANRKLVLNLAVVPDQKFNRFILLE